MFIYGFAKNSRGSVTADELQTMKEIAAQWLACDDAALRLAQQTEELQEIDDDQAS